jgi:hypothetical protein
VPFRSRATLESWLEEFRTTREGGALIDVLVQDGDGGADTGLVIVPLKNVSTEIYMQPAAIGDDAWVIAFGGRAMAFELTPAQLHGYAAELAVAASLCQYLEERSLGHEEPAD